MGNLSAAGKEEIVEMIIDRIDNLTDQYVCDLHNEIFNTDYFIIGTHKAKLWLNDNYGSFDAIGRVQEYEQDNFGQVTTDLSDPEKVVNMLVYILGEEIMYDCPVFMDNWDDTLTPKMVKKIKKFYKSY